MAGQGHSVRDHDRARRIMMLRPARLAPRSGRRYTREQQESNHLTTMRSSLMPYSIRNVEVWAADVYNRPGMLARMLEGLAQAGAQLEFMVARRRSENTARVFVSPIKGKKQQQAAADVGFVPAIGMHAVRIQGADRAGLGAEISRAVAAAGINIRGVAAATVGKNCVINLAFASPDDAKTATAAIRKQLSGKPKKRR